MQAINMDDSSKEDIELVDALSEAGNVAIPNAIEEIRSAKIRHNTVCEVSEMPLTVKKFLKME